MRTLLVGFLTCGLLAAGESALLPLIPEDAGSIVGFDVAKMINSPFGRRILSRMKLDDSRLQILFKLGFDPTQD